MDLLCKMETVVCHHLQTTVSMTMARHVHLHRGLPVMHFILQNKDESSYRNKLEVYVNPRNKLGLSGGGLTDQGK
jgi:hypothetical protein